MEVPDEWWRAACEVVDHPMACVSPKNQFVWVNQAFERLTGYSRSELRQRTWIDITLQEDVGGDLASVQAVIDGHDAHYSMSKRYKHKLGKEVPIQLTVHRFPQVITTQLTCFIVEAVPETATHEEIEELRTELEQGITNLELRWKLLQEEGRHAVRVSYHDSNQDVTGSENVVGGRDATRTANEGGRSWIAGWIAGALAVISVIGWALTLAHNKGLFNIPAFDQPQEQQVEEKPIEP